MSTQITKCLVNGLSALQNPGMLRPYLALALVTAAAAAACNSDSPEDAAGECSTENIVDDIDDGVGADAEEETPQNSGY